MDELLREILFALSRSFLPERPAGLVGILLLSLLAAIYGACWAGCLVVVYRCLRSARPQIEPGEWLLFCLGLILAVEVVTKLLPDQFIIQKPSLQLAADCGVLVIPTLSRRLATRWKLLFVGFVLSYALPLCIVLGETLGLWPRYSTGRSTLDNQADAALHPVGNVGRRRHLGCT